MVYKQKSGCIFAAALGDRVTTKKKVHRHIGKTADVIFNGIASKRLN